MKKDIHYYLDEFKKLTDDARANGVVVFALMSNGEQEGIYNSFATSHLFYILSLLIEEQKQIGVQNVRSSRMTRSPFSNGEGKL